MSEEITRDLFNKLVDLAALELEEEEAEYIRRQLNDQLTAIAELAAVPLDEETAAAAHGVPYTADTRAPFREDNADPFERPEEILKGAPEVIDRYIIAPETPHEDLK
jgi:aspartyl/glutamyl-tRNA(Asn/Gln) amidotransferase C subunit